MRSGLEYEQVCKGNKSELCCNNRGLRIEKMCEGAAASSPCCAKTACSLVQVKKVAGLLGSSDTALLANKTLLLQPVTAGIILTASLPKQTQLITFLCPSPTQPLSTHSS